MKKVFEGDVRLEGDSFGMNNYLYHEADVLDPIEGFAGKRVRVTVEELPEGKPEEKNCGNCKRVETAPLCYDSSSDDKTCLNWKAKSAAPQGWEGSLHALEEKTQCYFTSEQWDAIRAEIERVHAGYAPMIGAIEMAFKEADFLPDGRLTRKARAVFEPIRKALAEQNKHKEASDE